MLTVYLDRGRPDDQDSEPGKVNRGLPEAVGQRASRAVARRQVETLGSNLDQVKSARTPHKHPRSQRPNRPREARETAGRAGHGTDHGPVTARPQTARPPAFRRPGSAQGPPPQRHEGPAAALGRGPSAIREVGHTSPARIYVPLIAIDSDQRDIDRPGAGGGAAARLTRRPGRRRSSACRGGARGSGRAAGPTPGGRSRRPAP